MFFQIKQLTVQMHKQIIWRNNMNNRLLHLKIKIRNMADESKLIRQEESKLKAKARLHHERGYEDAALACREALSGLAEHRKNTHSSTCLRTYTRINLLAYAFLRGKTYKSVEPHSKDNAKQFAGDILKVVKNFSQYSENKDITVETITKWLTA